MIDVERLTCVGCGCTVLRVRVAPGESRHSKCSTCRGESPPIKPLFEQSPVRFEPLRPEHVRAPMPPLSCTDFDTFESDRRASEFETDADDDDETDEAPDAPEARDDDSDDE